RAPLVDGAVDAGVAGVAGDDPRDVGVGGQRALGAYVGRGVAGPKGGRAAGQDYAVIGLGRRRGDQEIAGTGGAGGFIDRDLFTDDAEVLGLGDLAGHGGGSGQGLGGGPVFLRCRTGRSDGLVGRDLSLGGP